ncbi:hypothetical protein PR003_g28325 [Phytophthora rubi]|uniref:RNase H type-1 domain-containing protein n=1 Tax=Phytophthora rubi TaxID=129364 RepID=A0A6A4BSQ2_9STRA|nr:hypothetical protein PR003_g28325 [Phytophthora rubi]
MAYGDNRTTNNMAEYRGLLHGLLRAKKTGLQHIHVVGDSKMIINQMQGRRSPLAAKLTRLYCHCRITADQCAVQSWTHHYRTHNKTAAALANLAMDSKVSRQISATGQDFPTGCWDGALRNVPHDLSEWQVGIPDLPERSGRTGHP